MTDHDDTADDPVDQSDDEQPTAAQHEDAAGAASAVPTGSEAEPADTAERLGTAPFQPDALQANRPDASSPPAGPLGLLNDVDMEVTVELGRTVMPIRELLALQPGMVVEIDRAAGAPIDVLVNGRLIARGEVVVIDEEFGVRIVDIVSQREVA